MILSHMSAKLSWKPRKYVGYVYLLKQGSERILWKPKFSSACIFCMKDVSMRHFKDFFLPLLEI